MNQSYHFDLGNTCCGPVGFSGRVVAENEEAAVTALREHLEAINREHALIARSPDSNEPGIEYLTVYFNPAAISTRDIDSVDELPELTPTSEA